MEKPKTNILEKIKLRWKLYRARKKKGTEIALTVAEIAEGMGMFPTDVEETLKVLQENGLVKCYMYKGELCAVFEGDLSELLLKGNELKKKQGAGSHHDPMFG